MARSKRVKRKPAAIPAAIPAASPAASTAEKDENNISTVKCALNKRCHSDELFAEIQKDVQEMSNLAVETSRYIHFDLMRKFEAGDFPTRPYDFRKYFIHLTRNGHEQLLPEYRELRGELAFYDSKSRLNIINGLEKQYTTVFKNNLKVHGYNRLRTFFVRCIKLLGLNVKLYRWNITNTLDYLFNAKKRMHSRMNIY